MCDFSLKHVASRPAVVGDKLITHNFEAGTSGFRATADKEKGDGATAVCVLPGTEIAFAKPIGVNQRATFYKLFDDVLAAVGTPPKSTDCVATFIQVNKDRVDEHHDALQFADGSIVYLTALLPDQEAEVLTLPAKPKTDAEKEHQRRAEFV